MGVTIPSHLNYPVAMSLTLKPVFLVEAFDLNLIVIVLLLDLRAEKPLGTEEPQSQTLVYFLMEPTKR